MALVKLQETFPRLNMWAGVECTVNRVRSQFFNQCDRSGHACRIDDLKLFASLGIKKIRYPFLWELAAPENPNEIDWSWSEERTAELQRLNLSPIAGFVHHGSGPLYTNLMDREFPEKLAIYAKQFALKYPWIKDYTPINEPLTTARFSGLYGVWYPHEKSNRAFLRALYTQTKATVLSMKAIRETIPDARLIQTEDMGKAQATEPIQYQADFENERRFLSYDLLLGKVNPQHKLYFHLLENEISVEELEWLEKNPCTPDVLGINHYLLSNRFLDHRTEFYPEQFHGGNGKHEYADVGAVDTTAVNFPEPEVLIQEVWDRYQLPIAITEVHLYGPREAQVRWLNQVYQSCVRAQSRGVQIEAVTPWSLLGSYDWNTLCTEDNKFYESGVFDLRSPAPRPTALARMIKNWSGVEDFEIPLTFEPGWWMDSTRAPFGPKLPQPKSAIQAEKLSRPILITGANGTLAKAFARICDRRKIPYKTLNRSQLNISNVEEIKRVIEEIRPWAVINSAGYVRVDDAEAEIDKCFTENVEGPKNLALACSSKKIHLIHFSSDLVFDGESREPYLESHPVSPLNVYGQSKVESEKFVMDIHPDSLILRTSSFFGPWDQGNFAYAVLNSLAKKQKFQAANDITVSPTYVPDLVEATLDLLIDGETGILHMVNEGQLTWAEWAQKLALATGGNAEHVLSLPSSKLNYTAKRPVFSALSSERIKILPTFDRALERYLAETEFNIKSS